MNNILFTLTTHHYTHSDSDLEDVQTSLQQDLKAIQSYAKNGYNIQLYNRHNPPPCTPPHFPLATVSSRR